MKLLLYEWCCSGGLAGGDAGSGCAGIVAEGRAMLEALAADAVRDGALDVTVLFDAVGSLTLPDGVRVRSVPAGGEIESLVAAASAADWTVIVAPETDGILRSRVAAVRTAGGKVLCSSDAFIAIAADKQATITALAATGVPVPAGRTLAAEESVPIDFHMPAVRKLRDGVGCDGFEVLDSAHDVVPARTTTRLETFAAGMPVGVSCLCGPGVIEVLPPMRQHFTDSGPRRYLGGEPLAPGLEADRAMALARRAVDAVAHAAGDDAPAGWVGVDMILGARDDGRADRVLEVNPRLTTSFVRLAAASPRSLVRTMLDVAAGTRVHDGAT
ncbi:MAG: ATP-grasp domain-containing protein [Planctomycetia bacterium]